MFQIKNLSGSLTEVEGEITAEEFERCYQKALKEAQETIEVPGFRRGSVPENIIREKVGEGAMLEKAAECAIKEHWPRLIKEADIEPLGRPEFSITRLARNNPLGFKVHVAVLQKIALPDYMSIARSIPRNEKPVEVTEEEIAKALEYIQSRAKEKNSPELNESPESLRAAIIQNITFEKELEAKEKHRIEILKAIVENTTLDFPQVVIDGELEKMIEEFRSRLSHMGFEWQQYLTHIKQSEEDLRKNFRSQAEERAKFGILLREIAKKENLIPSPEAVEEKTNELLRSLSKEDRAKASPESLRDYLFTRLQYEMTFQFLEKESNIV